MLGLLVAYSITAPLSSDDSRKGISPARFDEKPSRPRSILLVESAYDAVGQSAGWLSQGLFIDECLLAMIADAGTNPLHPSSSPHRPAPDRPRPQRRLGPGHDA